jgi:hypothetical protein
MDHTSKYTIARATAVVVAAGLTQTGSYTYGNYSYSVNLRAHGWSLCVHHACKHITGASPDQLQMALDGRHL